jgi:hypothetical protein
MIDVLRLPMIGRRHKNSKIAVLMKFRPGIVEELREMDHAIASGIFAAEELVCAADRQQKEMGAAPGRSENSPFSPRCRRPAPTNWPDDLARR